MKNIQLITNKKRPSFFGLVLSALLLTTVGCVEELELPEAGSLPDLTPPSASFSATESENFLIYSFSNTSKSATTYAWNFGDNGTSTEAEPTHEFPAIGRYTVTLVASDNLGVSNSFSKDINVEEPPIPPAVAPTIENGDFENSSYDAWKVDVFSDGTTRNPYNGSSDGEPMLYDGTAADSKTRGAKWTNSTSAAHLRSANSRHAYQAVTVSAEREYILEYSYAIKDDRDDVTGGDRVVVEILDGHFTDGVNAEAATRIITHVGDTALGKGNFTLVREQFTSNASGLISVWMWACTSEDAYIDNVKIYPAE